MLPPRHISSPLTRRDIVRAGAAGLLGMSLPQLLAAKEQAAIKQLAAPPVKAKAVILLFMWGGPAQQETWDLKPNDPRIELADKEAD